MATPSERTSDSLEPKFNESEGAKALHHSADGGLVLDGGESEASRA